MPSKVSSLQPSGDTVDYRSSPFGFVRRSFVCFIQGLFAYAPAGQYHWSADSALSEIIVTDESPIDTDVVGKRPAISFVRGPVRFTSLGFDDLLYYRQDIGRKTKSVLLIGSASINCCSRVEAESEDLAGIVAEHLWLLRDLFSRAGFFEVGRDIVVGSPSPAGSIVAGDQAREWFCTSIHCPLQIPRTSSVTPLGNEIFKRLQLQLYGQHTNVQSYGPALGSHDNPYSATYARPPAFSPASDARGGTPDPAGLIVNPLTKLPHPLNPSVTVTMRSLNAFRAGTRPPSMMGVPIPLATQRVRDSNVTDLAELGQVKVS